MSFDLILPASKRDSRPNQHDRDFITTIRPKVKDLDPSELEEWSVTGRVRSAVRLDVPELWFENTSRLAPLPEAKTATVTSFVELDHVDAICSSRQFLVSVERLRSGTEGYSIRVGPRQMLPVGPFRETVRIIPCLVGGKELPAIVLPVVGQIVPDIQAVPPSIAVGVQSIGGEIQESFALRSRTGSAFEVRSVRASGEGVSVTKRTDPAGATAYLVRQKVSKPGDQRGAIAFEVRAVDGVMEKLIVETTYYGVPPGTTWSR